MGDYWTWWIGALALGSLTILFRILIGRPLGVSSSWAAVVNWRQQKQMLKAEAQMQAQGDAATDAILAATMAEFGDTALSEVKSDTTDQADPGQTVAKTVPPLAHLLFLLFMFIGSIIATWLSSADLTLYFQMSDYHTLLSGGIVWHSWVYLLIGGIMVGVGTQMAAGCSSGHGLSGCAQLAPVSLLATATFFISAVLFSLFMDALI